MTLKNEYQRVIRKFNALPPKPRSELLLEITEQYITPDIEDCIEELCTVEKMGRVTATEVMFKMGAKINGNSKDKTMG